MKREKNSQRKKKSKRWRNWAENYERGTCPNAGYIGEKEQDCHWWDSGHLKCGEHGKHGSSQPCPSLHSFCLGKNHYIAFIMLAPKVYFLI